MAGPTQKRGGSGLTAAGQLGGAAMNTERVFRLMDALRSAGYRIDSTHYITAAGFAALLTAETGRLDAGRLKTLLGPVVCKSPAEQAGFPGLFERVWGVEGEGARRDPEDEGRAEELDRSVRELDRSARRWLAWAAAIVAGVLIAAAIVLSPASPTPANNAGPGQTAPPAQGATPKAPAGGANPEVAVQTAKETAPAVLGAFGFAAATGVVLAGLWILWWRRRARRFLQRGKTFAEPEVATLSIQPNLDRMFEMPAIARLARGMRRKELVQTGQLWVERTIARTIENGGFFEPVYGTRLVTPEYTVLIDRRGPGDLTARLGEELVERLRQRGVDLHVYYFDRTPAVVSSRSQPGRMEMLAETASRRYRDRLVVVSNADTAADAESWTAHFKAWERRILVTTGPLDRSRPTHKILEQRFRVYEATSDGLAVLARDLEGAATRSGAPAAVKALLPEILRTRTGRLLDAEEPHLEEKAELVGALRAYLGPDGFYWLSACAAYPEIHPNLTLHLGNVLQSSMGDALFDAELLLRLSRLVWFQRSYMPDWLRRSLLDSLTTTQEEAVRQALEGLLFAALAGHVSEDELHVARRYPQTVSRLVRGFVAAAGRQAKAGELFADAVFVSLVSNRLAVSLPRAVLNYLKTGDARGRVLAQEPAFGPWVRWTVRALLLTGTAAILVWCEWFATNGAAFSGGYFLGSIPVLAVASIVCLAAAVRARSVGLVSAGIAFGGPYTIWGFLMAVSMEKSFLLTALGAAITAIGTIYMFATAWVGTRRTLPVVEAGAARRGVIGVGLALSIAHIGLLILWLPKKDEPLLLWALAAAVLAGPVLALATVRTGARVASLLGVIWLMLLPVMLLGFVSDVTIVAIAYYLIATVCLLFAIRWWMQKNEEVDPGQPNRLSIAAKD